MTEQVDEKYNCGKDLHCSCYYNNDDLDKSGKCCNCGNESNYTKEDWEQVKRWEET